MKVPALSFPPPRPAWRCPRIDIFAIVRSTNAGIRPAVLQGRPVMVSSPTNRPIIRPNYLREGNMRSMRVLAAVLLSCWRSPALRLPRSKAASSGSIIGTARPAPRSMRRRPTRSTFPSCPSSTTSSSTNRTWRRTAWSRSSRISRRAGPGAATTRRSASSCGKASPGTTASRSRPTMSNARSTC